MHQTPIKKRVKPRDMVVRVRMTSAEYKALVEHSREQEMSLSAVMRQGLRVYDLMQKNPEIMERAFREIDRKLGLLGKKATTLEPPNDVG